MTPRPQTIPHYSSAGNRAFAAGKMRGAVSFILGGDAVTKECAMTYPEIETFVRNWNYTHKQTARILRAAPQEKMEWQPKEGLFTLRQLVSHFPQAELGFVRTAMEGFYSKVELDLSKST